MPDSRVPALCAALVFLLVPLLGPASAGSRDPLHVWTDADGVTRYTTHLGRIPLARRGEAEVVAVRHDPAALDARITELERQIAADEELLAAHLSREDAPRRADIEAVAGRLPRLQAQLRDLLERRDALPPADAP